MQFSFLHLIRLDMEDIPPGSEKIPIGGGKREEKCNCTIFYPRYPTFVALSDGRRGHAAEVTSFFSASRAFHILWECDKQT